MATPNTDKTIDRYVLEINRHPILNREDEQALAVRFVERGDTDAAHGLVVGNLRFVVKVAHEYRGYGLRLLDLIQEGNIGLMKAVQKFDPKRGYRLISYAVWWIRAYIQNYIMRSWSLVKLGTTQVQRRLFFKLRSESDRADRDSFGQPGDAKVLLASRLGVNEHQLSDMEQRLAARDFSLDVEVQDGARQTHLDMLAAGENDQEEVYAELEERHLLRLKVSEAMVEFNDKERFIVERRLMTEERLTLQQIGENFGISRERARQIEGVVLRKLRTVLSGTGLEGGRKKAA